MVQNPILHSICFSNIEDDIVVELYVTFYI
jgi:hypothetical protein